jgi:hypothetical protein
MKSMTSWIVTPCSTVEVHQSFRGKYHLLLWIPRLKLIPFFGLSPVQSPKNEGFQLISCKNWEAADSLIWSVVAPVSS